MDTVVKTGSMASQICKIEYCPDSDVNDVFCMTSFRKVKVVLTAGASWKQIAFTKPAKLIQSSSSGKEGPTVNASLDFSIARTDDDFLNAFGDAPETKLLFKIEYADGSIKLMGDKNNCPRVQIEIDDEAGLTKVSSKYTSDRFLPIIVV